jgi:hypothetical protein
MEHDPQGHQPQQPLDPIMQTLLGLQEQVMRMQERHDEVLGVLQNNGLIGTRGVIENIETRAHIPTPDVPTHPLQPTRAGPKPALPSDFDGDRTKGRAFLNTVKWYLRSRGQEFRDHDHMIAWTLSFMKEGRALTFANQVTRQMDRTGQVPFESWDAFWKELETRFLPIDEAEEAINILETDRYFQGKQTVDDYCDRFQDLVDHARYSDGRQVVMKFRKGLDLEIADKVALMQEGRPRDDNLEAWIHAAKEVARQRIRNEAFNQAVRKEKTYQKPLSIPPLKGTSLIKTTPQLGKPSFPTFSSRPMGLPRMNPTEVPPSIPPRPTMAGPVPMEVDASRNKGRVPIVCHRCSQPGHLKNQCPRRFDVRFMTTDELEEVLQDQLASRDAATVAALEVEEEEGMMAQEGDEDRVELEGFQDSRK